jgi:hypothetical protein
VHLPVPNPLEFNTRTMRNEIGYGKSITHIRMASV